MNNVRLTVQQLVTLVENKPQTVKALNQSERRLLRKSFSIFQDSSKEIQFEKQSTELRGLIAKLEQSASSKSLKKYCSSGFFHFIFSIFKGFANLFGRVSTKELISNGHKIYENHIKKTLSSSPTKPSSSSISATKSTPNKDETFAMHYENFKSLQFENYKKVKGPETVDQDLNETGSTFFQQWMTPNLFKNYLTETVSIIGTRVEEGPIDESDLDQIILKFTEIGFLSEQKNELEQKFEALRKDLIKYKQNIINHFYFEGEFEYREKCIEMFYNVSKHAETIMQLYDQEESLREEFWNRTNRRYPEHKHKFASNRYAEKHLGFIIHSENPRAEVETALKFGPINLIQAYEKAKSMDEETLEEFFKRAFNSADACFEIKNTTIGDFTADISSKMNDKPLMDANRLINPKLNLIENANLICDEFIDRRCRDFCRDTGQKIALSTNRWSLQKAKISVDDKFKDYLYSNKLYSFLKDEVEAIGKKIAISFEDEDGTKITEEYQLQESDLKEIVEYCIALGLIEKSPEP